ncbi:LytTR family transcriptional regulator DNA-binding domain-containing protein [Flavihumibacter profundi]|uniref:LytTR family transcriptional regulator DNA-binding domain-containing protein n=1 Tax=Flavihumibacter profundi TaxID=2716883 RepID=UPI001CC763D4|nr:LytTR family transcriptional regulator DNA-binding domain-containing protein [Flavihumibacter profundi]MBZ5859098.1 LytTR family transcriptional regulator DNA-binding domain-containing protein [Flavihumibacter profundi]
MFVRIHRSCLVAIQPITFYMEGIVYLCDFELPAHTLSACPLGLPGGAAPVTSA